ncbi:GNAT family N-acetyltransferase [Polluticaenibacter yanchengensis]|uniref:GNAT family N-acetyltransferase n=1 Tax=Polluticaenibacter yanchengensis TaxID=3014562 RepID=A0ABT4UHJ0_9BACT|nr:GNAT family N-acetyltransferase [Chitinophagaceae bacterium LY-5]
MKIFAETPRLILREVEHSDAADLFEMDSDPEVHLYIENKPVKTISEITPIIQMLRKQYRENGIARWAVVDKITGECIGWSGLKYYSQPLTLNDHSHIYELGYRFKKKHWGKGYATEAAIAVLNYGFSHLDPDTIYAITDPKNISSQKVLHKLGFQFIEVFNYQGDPTNWFELKKVNWKKEARINDNKN